MKLLSIIIPSYNMEAYIEQCLNSLVVKEGMDKLEVLVINDGSKDNTSALAHAFQEKWPDTFRVIDKENGHYGSCVNRGLQEAAGKYVKVLDADDWFDTAALEVYLRKLSTTDTDIVISGVSFVIDGVHHDKNIKLPADTPLSIYDVYDNKTTRWVSMHAFAHRRELLTSVNYHQTEGIHYTDNEWIFAQLSQAKTLIYFPEILYLYRIGREGQSVNIDVRKKIFKNEIRVADGLLNCYKSVEAGGDVWVLEMLKNRLELHFKGLFRTELLIFHDFYNEEFRAMDERLKKACPDVYKRLGRIPASTPLLPFWFIAIWRKNPDSRLLKWVAETYRRKKKISL